MTGAEGLPEPGRRHWARRSRAYGATCSSSYQVAGWDADQAVAALYREHYRSLAWIAALLLDDSELAEEITQDAFVPCSAHGGGCGTAVRPYATYAGR
jgi:hypothetical protein